MKATIALIGPGRVGCAVTRKLFEAGYRLTAVVGRQQQQARAACQFIGSSTSLATEDIATAAAADIVLLAVPDDDIHTVAGQLHKSGLLQKKPVLVHFSGLHPATIMKMASSVPTLLSLHPLLPFASHEKGYAALDRCPCVIESPDMLGIKLGKELVSALGGVPFTIEADKKALYHAAACISSNYLVTLFAVARDLLVHCGIEEDRALPLLLPLVQTTLDNIEQLGPELGLTGPVSRGDSGTVAKHLQSISQEIPNFLPLYREMGMHTVQLAQKSARLNPQHADVLCKLLSPADRNRVESGETEGSE